MNSFIPSGLGLFIYFPNRDSIVRLRLRRSGDMMDFSACRNAPCSNDSAS